MKFDSKNKCDLCGKKREFRTHLILCDNEISIRDKIFEKINVCPDCRKKPINDVYKFVMEKITEKSMNDMEMIRK